MPLLELTNLSKSYTDPGSGARVPVLRGISLKIEAGESLAIVSRPAAARARC